MTYPTWEEIFYKPWPPPIVPCPAAWQAESIAVDVVDQECARLMGKALSDPPITRDEFKKAMAQVEARRARG